MAAATAEAAPVAFAAAFAAVLVFHFDLLFFLAFPECLIYILMANTLKARCAHLNANGISAIQFPNSWLE
ncbi:hypothetical protein ACFU99_44160 [Streptomyces sp. NPDC057654]|uniref:hypothetical protein n=1 Tax=Streptomyces sp. NPDC057654 TaxID=3346196 RepID=UPI0036813FB4